MLPPLPMHGGDRNRTSPFAFTGNKFEFRALGSSMSLAFPNTVLNTIAAEAIDELADKLEAKISGGSDLPEAVIEIVKDSYAANKQVCFGGDNYSEEWHAEAEQRGLKNLRTTPDALPEVLAEQTVAAFENYDVLSKRELESRYEVWVEQYAIRANIEAETTLSIAKTMILPAALRYLALIDEAGVSALEGEVRGRWSTSWSTRSASWRRPTPTPTASRASSWRSTPATTSSRRWRRSARPPTSSRRSSPTTSGRCRSTRRCSSSSRASEGGAGDPSAESTVFPRRGLVLSRGRGPVCKEKHSLPLAGPPRPPPHQRSESARFSSANRKRQLRSKRPRTPPAAASPPSSLPSASTGP